MLYSTEGIVLNTLRYSDSSTIAKIYTRLFGLQSYIVPSGRSKKTKTKITLLQPLANVSIIVSRKEKNTLHHIQEIQCHEPYANIPYNIVKSSMALFLNEILYKCIREEEPNELLFEFIRNSLHILDVKEDEFNNFHLLFMMKLSKYLGFYPQGTANGLTPYFDMQEGVFVNYKPSHPFYIADELAKYFYALLNYSYENINNAAVPVAARKKLLSTLVSYFELHLSTVKDVKSHHVLAEVMA